VRIVGVVLVHNEDVFVERAVRNVAAFCDRIYAFDHASTDRTGEVLSGLDRELDHVSVERTDDARESHRVLEPYAGSETWVLGIDGDELYDPDGLARLRQLLEQGAYADAFHLKAHVLNCTALDEEDGSAAGHMSPPSRPVTKLFNLAAVESWAGCPQRLHGGAPQFRSGFDWSSLRYVSEETEWSTDPLRMLHVCFLRRSSSEEEAASPVARRNLSETGAFRRGARGLVHRLRYRRHIDPRMKAYRAQGSTWKQEWYARGPVQTVDASPFLGANGTDGR
jgi:glycosyl transferase family 2